MGGPLWVDAPSFDIAEHVGVLSLDGFGGRPGSWTRPSTSGPGAWTRPVPCGRCGSSRVCRTAGSACSSEIHHAIADGLAAMMMLGALFDPAPDLRRTRRRCHRARHRSPRARRRSPHVPGRPRDGPSSRRLLPRQREAQCGRHRRGVCDAAPPPGDGPADAGGVARGAGVARRRAGARTSIDRLIGSDCRLAVVRSSHGQVRRIGRAHDATVNDILLAATAGGLRALLVSRGEPVDGLEVRIYVPVTLRRRLRGGEQGTQIAQMVVPLPVGEPDPVRRLRLIAAETTRRKARIRTSLGTLFRGRIVRLLMLLAVIRQHVNITSASIPGPRRPLSLAGARMLEVFPSWPSSATCPSGSVPSRTPGAHHRHHGGPRRLPRPRRLRGGPGRRASGAGRAGRDRVHGGCAEVGSMSPAETDLWRLGATELAAAIRSRRVSSREVVEAHLRRIEAVNPTVNAVTVVLGDQARLAADGGRPRGRRRRRSAAPPRRPLHGQGQHRPRRHADHPGAPGDGGRLPAHGCPGRRAAPGGRGDPDRPHEPPRPSAWAGTPTASSRADREPVGPHAHPGRLERRRGRGARHGHDARWGSGTTGSDRSAGPPSAAASPR